MALSEGIDLALDKVLKEPTQQPEQLAKRESLMAQVRSLNQRGFTAGMPTYSVTPTYPTVEPIEEKYEPIPAAEPTPLETQMVPVLGEPQFTPQTVTGPIAWQGKVARAKQLPDGTVEAVMKDTNKRFVFENWQAYDQYQSQAPAENIRAEVSYGPESVGVMGDIQRWNEEIIRKIAPRPESEAEGVLWIALLGLGAGLPLAGSAAVSATEAFNLSRALPGITRVAAQVGLAPEMALEQVLGLPLKGLIKAIQAIGNVEVGRNITRQVTQMIQRVRSGEVITEKELSVFPESVANKLRPILNQLDNLLTEERGSMRLPRKPQEPIVPPVAPASEELDNILASMFRRAKTARGKLEAVKSEEFVKRLKDFADRQAEAKTFKEALEARTSLRGKLIPPEMEIMPTWEKITPEMEQSLLRMVRDFPLWERTPMTQSRTIEALQKMFVYGQLPTRGELENISKILPQLSEEISRNYPLWSRIWAGLAEALNLPRAILASGDLSAGRQMAFMMPRYPIKSVRAFWSGAKAGLTTLFNGDYALLANEALQASKMAPIREEAGLYIAPIEGIVKGATTVAGREEAYYSSILQRLARDFPEFSPMKKVFTAPIMPLAKLTQTSEAAFVTTLNQFRAAVFDDYATMWGGKATLAELKGLAEFINIGTGRGVVPSQVQDWMPFLQAVLFSPRLQLSRLEFLAMPITLWKYPPNIRKIVIQNIASFLGATGSIMGLAKVIGGDAVSIETDSNSSDYGKIKVGDTRLDPWGGLQQYIKLASRLVSGEMKTSGGETVDIDREEEVLRFFRSKEAPAVGFFHDLLKGQTFVGEETIIESEDKLDAAREEFAPLFAQDMYEALRQDGWLGGLVAWPGFFGVGIVSYPSKTYADWLTSTQETLGKEWSSDENNILREEFNVAEASWYEYLQLPRGRAREYYLEQHPEVDASLYFWGEVKSLQDPEKSEPMVQAMLNKFGLPRDILPIREPVEPYKVEGRPEEVFNDFVTILPKNVSDYVMANQAQWQGTDWGAAITAWEQIKINENKLIEQYYRETSGKDPSIKQRYRQQHPEIDAALVFWRGLSTVQSPQARQMLIDRCDSLGLPYNIFDALTETAQGGSWKKIKSMVYD